MKIAKIAAVILTVILALTFVPAVFAEGDNVPADNAAAVEKNSDTASEPAEDASEEDSATGLLKTKAVVAAAAMGLACVAGAVCMTVAIKSASDNMARQPEASGEIRSNTMLGLVFIETAIIYALIVAILIIFVL